MVERAQTHSAPRVGAMGNPKCVFLMEKDGELCEVLEALLSLLGFTVSTFRTSQALLEGLHQNTPHCLILDLYSPPGDRYQLVEKIRLLQPQLPILFMTLENPVRYFDSLNRYQQISFIRKPFTSETFQSTLEGILLKEGENGDPVPVRRPEDT